MWLFEETLEILQVTLVVCGYIFFAYALPSLFIQRSLRKHYREWIVDSGAYWRRASDKWIIRNRVFYTDELTWDIITSIFSGIVFGNISARILLSYLEIDQQFMLITGTAISSALLLFIFAQLERIRIIDATLEIKKMTDPQFDNESEIKQILDNDHQFIKKVVGHRPKNTQMDD